MTKKTGNQNITFAIDFMAETDRPISAFHVFTGTEVLVFSTKTGTVWTCQFTHGGCIEHLKKGNGRTARIDRQRNASMCFHEVIDRPVLIRYKEQLP